MATNILVTGSQGSIGYQIADYLQKQGHSVVWGMRSHAKAPGPVCAYGDLSKPFQIDMPIDSVIHCAGIAHQKDEKDIGLYQSVNVKGTEHVMQAARKAGMRRIIFLSTIKVLGDKSAQAFKESMPPQPIGAYAQSKLDAECRVQAYAKQYGLEYVIIRPPLVYGLDKLQGNLHALKQVLKWRLPLPFANVRNTRSLVHIHNLCSFVDLCLHATAASGEIFHVADKDFSTPQLIKTLAKNHRYPAMLFPFTQRGLRLLAGANKLDKLTGTLAVCADKAKQLGWQPDLEAYSR